MGNQVKRIYIAGYIGNDPNAFSKFVDAAAQIVIDGHIPVNPMALPHDNHNGSWEQYMVTDLHAMLDCDEVHALPCWKKSKGATIEVQLALRLNKPVRFVERLK